MGAWSFHRRRGTCSGCQRPFRDGESHHSALSLLGDGVVREDLCGACWPVRLAGARSTPEGPPTPLYWWRTHHEVGRRGLALNLEAIAALFLALAGRTEPNVGQLRYVLGLLLMRKRRLKLVRVVREGDVETLIVRRPGHPGELALTAFALDAERMVGLKQELQTLFDAEDSALAGLAAQPQSASLPEAGGEAS